MAWDTEKKHETQSKGQKSSYIEYKGQYLKNKKQNNNLTFYITQSYHSLTKKDWF